MLTLLLPLLNNPVACALDDGRKLSYGRRPDGGFFFHPCHVLQGAPGVPLGRQGPRMSWSGARARCYIGCLATPTNELFPPNGSYKRSLHDAAAGGPAA